MHPSVHLHQQMAASKVSCIGLEGGKTVSDLEKLSSSIALLAENLGKLADISNISCELSDEVLLIPCLCRDKLCMSGEKYKWEGEKAVVSKTCMI